MTSLSEKRPVMRGIEDAGGGRVRDCQTKDLVSTRAIVAEYNEMLRIVRTVAVLGAADAEAVADARRLLKEGARYD
jgi:hypothetical protein